MMSAMAIAEVRLAIFFALASSISTVFQLTTQDTSCSAHFSRFYFTLYSNWNFKFLVNQVSCDEYCWYTLHGAWWWTALWPYHRPFPSVRPCKTNVYQHLTHMVVQVPGISGVMISAQLDWYALPWFDIKCYKLSLLPNISWKLQLVLLYTGCLQLKILHLVLVLLGFWLPCGWKIGFNTPC